VHIYSFNLFHTVIQSSLLLIVKVIDIKKKNKSVPTRGMHIEQGGDGGHMVHMMYSQKSPTTCVFEKPPSTVIHLPKQS
jgi:hypothetical protein